VIFWKVLPWLIAIVLVSVGIGVGCFLTAQIYGSKTASQLSRQYLGVVFLFMIPYMIILYLLPASYKDSLRTTLFIAVSGFLISLLIAQVEGSRRVKIEQILLDLGGDPNGVWLLLVGAFALSFSVAFIILGISNPQARFQTAAQVVLSIVIGVLGLYKGSTKTVFTENGIFSIAGYIEWTNIRSHEWQGNKLFILKLKLRNSWVTLNKASINIAASNKDAVEALLAKKQSQPKITKGYETA